MSESEIDIPVSSEVAQLLEARATEALDGKVVAALVLEIRSDDSMSFSAAGMRKTEAIGLLNWCVSTLMGDLMRGNR